MNKYATQSRASQSRRRRLANCARKRRYPTPAEAHAANSVIYFCDFCGGYHRSHSIVSGKVSVWP